MRVSTKLNPDAHSTDSLAECGCRCDLSSTDFVDITRLAKTFASHVGTLKSAAFVCSRHASFESWFRVELIPTLNELGVPTQNIRTDFTYPKSRSKADLILDLKRGHCVFELKPFVRGQESQKMTDFPRQLRRLIGLLGTNEIVQVIAFTTFIGYGPEALQNRVRQFFGNDPWHSIGPMPVLNRYPLQMCIANVRVTETAAGSENHPAISVKPSGHGKP